MGSRENILARIRRQQGRSGPTSAEEMELVRANIRTHSVGPQPEAARAADVVEKFKSECARLLTTVGECALEQAPVEAARYLAAEKLGTSIAGWPDHAELDWAGAGIDYGVRAARADDSIGLTGCFCAIAETGTLFMLSSPEHPKLNALLPETHICIVPKARIVRTMEEAFALMRKEIGEPPRAMFFASGPSRTADIEQTIVIGAHGPYRVHVILV
jgi:L-lactate dehydrogenase complex protein LldG